MSGTVLAKSCLVLRVESWGCGMPAQPRGNTAPAIGLAYKNWRQECRVPICLYWLHQHVWSYTRNGNAFLKLPDGIKPNEALTLDILWETPHCATASTTPPSTGQEQS